MNERPVHEISVFERHAQTALVALVVAILSWVGYTTDQTAISMARLETRIDVLIMNNGDLQDQLEELRARIRALEQKP